MEERAGCSQMGGFPLTSREWVMGITTGKTPAQVWLPEFSAVGG